MPDVSFAELASFPESFIVYSYLYSFLMNNRKGTRYRMDLMRDAYQAGEYELIVGLLIRVSQTIAVWLYEAIDEQGMVEERGMKWQYSAEVIPEILWRLGPGYLQRLAKSNGSNKMEHETFDPLRRELEARGWKFQD